MVQKYYQKNRDAPGISRTFAETKKKLRNEKEDDTEAPKVRKNRRSDTDTLAYLKEKSDKELESKEKELLQLTQYRLILAD